MIGAEAGFKAEYCIVEDLSFAVVAVGDEVEELGGAFHWFRKAILGHKGIERYPKRLCDFEQ